MRRLVAPFRQLNRRPAERQLLDPELRLQLQEQLADDVDLASGLVGRDLAALWWKRGDRTSATESEMRTNTSDSTA
jgi:hypothetical protein